LKKELKPASLFCSAALQRQQIHRLPRMTSSSAAAAPGHPNASLQIGREGTRDNQCMNRLIGAMNDEWSNSWRMNGKRTLPRKMDVQNAKKQNLRRHISYRIPPQMPLRAALINSNCTVVRGGPQDRRPNIPPNPLTMRK
jgi:hypothetical protein